MVKIPWGIRMKAEYEDLRMDEFKTYAWLIHQAGQCREKANKSESALERGQFLAAAHQFEREAHDMASMESDELLFF